MSNFDELLSEMERGKNEDIIPMGFDRLSAHVGLRRSTYYLLGGYTGSGKTALLDNAFVLNPYDWYIKNKHNTNVKLHIIYFSMERKTSHKIAKWTSRKIFLDQGIIVSPSKILGWGKKGNKLTDEENDLVKMYKPYFDEMEEYVDIIAGPQNPMHFKKYVDKYARSHGHFEKISEYKSVYIADDPSEIVEILYDHIGLQKPETRKTDSGSISYRSKKEIIDLSSGDARDFRDVYGYSPVKLSQFNRDISNPIRIKNGSVEPSLEDFRESSVTQDDADVVMALFDPIRYKIAFPEGKDTLGYELDKLREPTGAKKYRSLRILKNSYGADDIGIGLGFQPVTGVFKELPKSDEITQDTYERVIDNSYFLID